MLARRILRVFLAVTCVVLVGVFASEWMDANETRARYAKQDKKRDKRYDSIFETIQYGSTPADLEEKIGWAGTESAGIGWPKTVRDVPDLEPIFVAREKRPPDEKVIWIVWKIDGPVKYIAAGCVKREDGLKVVARMCGLYDAAEPAG